MPGVPCPVCGSTKLAVVDKRDRPNKIWRRRQCPNGHRFNTIEQVVRRRVKFNIVRARALREDGYKFHQIAKLMGVSVSTIFNAVNDK